MRRHWPILASALIIWLTLLLGRSGSVEELGLRHVIAILAAAGCWFALGSYVSRIAFTLASWQVFLLTPAAPEPRFIPLA